MPFRAAAGICCSGAKQLPWLVCGFFLCAAVDVVATFFGNAGQTRYSKAREYSKRARERCGLPFTLLLFCFVVSVRLTRELLFFFYFFLVYFTPKKGSSSLGARTYAQVWENVPRCNWPSPAPPTPFREASDGSGLPLTCFPPLPRTAT